MAELGCWEWLDSGWWIFFFNGGQMGSFLGRDESLELGSWLASDVALVVGVHMVGRGCVLHVRRSLSCVGRRFPVLPFFTGF